jgi:hypothetical protein
MTLWHGSPRKNSPMELDQSEAGPRLAADAPQAARR